MWKVQLELALGMLRITGTTISGPYSLPPRDNCSWMSPDPSPDGLSFFHSLPRAVHDDVENIKGNLTLEQKQLCANILEYFVVAGNAYGSEVGKRIQLVEINVTKEDGRGVQGRTVCEVEVAKGETRNALRRLMFAQMVANSKDMCNIYGTLHGGCAAYLIDACVPCSDLSLLLLIIYYSYC
jgi:hypothetical protein